MALFASLLLPSLSVSANAEWVYEYENIRIAKEDDEDFKHDDAFASLNSFVILQCTTHGHILKPGRTLK